MVSTSKLEIQRNGQVLQSFESTQIRLVPVSCSEVLQIELKIGVSNYLGDAGLRSEKRASRFSFSQE